MAANAETAKSRDPDQRTRGQVIGHRIRERILEGSYPPGFHMNEVELSASFGVSRTPIRAALTKLAAEGLLAYTPNTGYVVRSFSREDVVRIYEVRAVLFGLAAQRAAANGFDETYRLETAEILAKSEALLAKAEWSPQSSESWGSMGARFVAVIEEAAGNPYLLEASRRSRDIPQLTAIRFRWLNRHVAHRLHLSHIDLLYAIENQQQSRAENLAREHVLQLCQSAMKEIEA